ncbi:response regulator transcription factor [Novosphingobium flavum]|uniref:Response regulator transcription factor n=1 Tax=Novosphingobium flavum TaxID=1778672 RepID=A0A7X1FUC3_9SPHN|nr:response regulator transcription factor [Novosphingobium flavum]MBC2667113.1 response regulator transcription factor [Novosphingobium flavum]
MTSILLADDHAFIRAGVEAVLGNTDYRIVANVGSGREALAAVRELDPAVCVFDVTMPDGDGVETLRAMRRAGDNRPVILLTAQIDDARLLDALDAGVNGIVGKEGAEETLADTIDAVLEGRKAIGPDLIERARKEATRRKTPSPMSVLTRRERTIVSFVAQGYRNRDIASELGITEGTVKVYLHSLYQKLAIENRTELAVLALRHRDELA